MNVGSLVSARCWLNSVWVIAILSQGTAFAEDSVLVEFDIDAQELGDALTEFGVQSGTEVYFVSADVAGVQAPRIEGKYSEIDVIRQLLGSSGVEYFIDGNGTLLVGTAYTAGTTPSQGGDSDSKNSSPAPILMAQMEAEETNPTPTDRSENGDRPKEESGRGLAEYAERSGETEEIIVRGRNTGIQRFRDDAQPYVVFDATVIENSFATNVEDFLRQRLPQNAIDTTSRQSGNSLRSNQSQIDLRGLGADQTLILLNGRRIASSSIGSEFGQPDINGIPLSAIERIEVLPSTASGIYGGGATGGAINIVLKSDYQGLSIDARYENTFDSDVSQKLVNIAGGLTFEEGRSSILFSGSYSDSNALLVRDRNFARQGRQLRSDTIGYSDVIPGYTTNIQSRDGSPLVLDDGTELGSARTFVPVGYAGPGLDGGVALAQNAGQFNLDLANDIFGDRSTLLGVPTTYAFDISAQRRFSPWLKLFVEYGQNTNEGEQLSGGAQTFARIPANAPTNPFQQDVEVSFALPPVDITRYSTTETERFVLGGNVDLSRGWAVNFDYGWSKSTFDAESTIAPFDMTSLRDGVEAGVYDVFRDLNVFPLEIDALSHQGPDEIYGPVDTELSNFTVRASGPLMTLPAGPINVAALAERRSEKIEDSFFDERDDFTDDFTSFYQPSRERDTYSYYVEANIPIIGSNNRKSLARELEFQLAVRHDDYTTTNIVNGDDSSIAVPNRAAPVPNVEYIDIDQDSTDYTIGLRYKPTETLLVRASYATGFILPQLSALATREFDLPFFIGTDPRRENTPVFEFRPFTFITGGNPDIQPEEAESWSVGFVYQPNFVDGLRISVDYNQIDKTDEIGGLPGDPFMWEDQFPDVIVREPLTPEDEALGYTGGLAVAQDFRVRNLSETRIKAIDFQFDYDVSTNSIGDFHFYLIGTYSEEFKIRAVEGEDFTDYVGTIDGPLKWRGNVGIDYYRNDLVVGWNMQYYDGRTELNDFVLGSQTFHDVFARYSFNVDRFSGLSLRVGVQNLFDQEPETVPGEPGYSTFGDPRMRRYSIELSAEF